MQQIDECNCYLVTGDWLMKICYTSTVAEYNNDIDDGLPQYIYSDIWRVSWYYTSMYFTAVYRSWHRFDMVGLCPASDGWGSVSLWTNYPWLSVACNIHCVLTTDKKKKKSSKSLHKIEINCVKNYTGRVSQQTVKTGIWKLLIIIIYKCVYSPTNRSAFSVCFCVILYV